MRRGRFIALSPKSYCAYDADRDKKKMAFKGKFDLIGRPQAGRPASSSSMQQAGRAIGMQQQQQRYGCLQNKSTSNTLSEPTAACCLPLLAACCLPLLAACKPQLNVTSVQLNQQCNLRCLS